MPSAPVLLRALARPTNLIAIAGCLAAALLVILLPFGLTREAAGPLAVAMAMVVLLATGALPEHVTGVCCFAAAMLFQLAPSEVVFSGFLSTAFWLVFGGLVISVGVRRSGLAQRIATLIARRMGTRYAGIIVGLTALGVALAFLMPSTMGRILILMPIVLAMADRYGFGPGSNGRSGMILAMSFGTMLPGFAILPATVPAVVLVGVSETLYGVAPIYGEWLLLHFPVLGLLKAVAIAAILIWLFPDTAADGDAAAPPAAPGEGSAGLMFVLLLAALGLWMTDFLHHISPAWISLAVAAICILPFVNLVPADAFGKEVSYGTLFYLAAAMALGPLMLKSGMVEPAMQAVLAHVDLEAGGPLAVFGAVVGVTTLAAMVLTHPGVSSGMVPLAGSLADAAAIPLESVLMMIAVGFSTVVLPYQTPPLIVAMQIGGVPLAAGNRFCLALFLVSIAVLVPLDYLWWLALGRL